MYNLSDRTILLGVTGSIAIYKAVDLGSKLTQAGARVYALMTPSATQFIRPVTFQSVTGRPAYADMWDPHPGIAELHVDLARRADLMVVAPATATTIARLALGSAEEMVSLTALATTAPIIVCPAMDNQMYEHPATQGHLQTLASRGVRIVGPEVGRLASGQRGPGRLSEIDTIMGVVRYVVGRDGDLAKKKVLVTAGGTQEPIDPVRYIGNYSSGKMGYALAEAARDRGADVTVVVGPTALSDPFGVDVVHVTRATEMRDAVLKKSRGASALIMAAAVADYQPAEAAGQKIKRNSDSMTVSLAKTPDILAEVGERRRLVKVAFAAETQNVLENARRKLEAKAVHLIVANDVTAKGSGFAADTNEVTILDRDGGREKLPLMPKYDVANRILDRVVRLMVARVG
jgi:phosphopantothenoylcysteine decarboxylase/phosphopantothenate--cysteine ligase